MERVIVGHELSAERKRDTVDLLNFVSGISLHGAPHLGEFPRLISINDQLADVMRRVWGASKEFGAEATSTVLTTFNGDNISSADIIVGGHSAARAEKLVPPGWGRFYRPRVNIHTHLEPYPFSIGDLLNLLKKRGRYSTLSYFPAMMVINESGIWAAIRSKETLPIEEQEFWCIANGLDHRVTNDAYWQNIDLVKFIEEYSIALYRGEGRNARLLVKIPKLR